MQTGLKNMAQRIVNAERGMVDTLRQLGNISEVEALRVFAYYRKHKLIKLDPVGGTYHVKHGAFMDRDVIRRAVTA